MEIINWNYIASSACWLCKWSLRPGSRESRLSLPQLPWSQLPAPCSQAPDSMFSPPGHWVWFRLNKAFLHGWNRVENSMHRGAWRATVHGVANSLSTTECVRHSISFDIIVNLLCVKCSAPISLSYTIKKSLIQTKSDPECPAGENMESGAWEQGTGSWLHESWGGERRDSRERGLKLHLHNQHALRAM